MHMGTHCTGGRGRMVQGRGVGLDGEWVEPGLSEHGVCILHSACLEWTNHAALGQGTIKETLCERE